MPRHLALLLTASLFGGLIHISAASPQAAQPSAQRPALDVVEPTDHDLGNMPATEIRKFSIRLVNRGDTPIQIHRIHAPCGCTALPPVKSVLDPKESVEIPVTFDPHGLYGNVIRQIDFQSSDPARPAFTWRFKANVQPSSLPQPKTVFIPIMEGLPAEEQRQAITVPFRFVPIGKAITVKSLALDENIPLDPKTDLIPKITWKLENGEVKGTVGFDMAAITPEKAALNRNKFQKHRLVLKQQDGTWDYIDLAWRLESPIWANPERIVIRDAKQHEERVTTFRVLWRSSKPMPKPKGARSTSKDITVTFPADNAPQQPGTSSFLVSVAYKPSIPGKVLERIFIDLDDPEIKSITVPLAAIIAPAAQ